MGVQDLPIILGDAQDQSSLDKLAAQSKVVIATAGPFARYGTPIVDACVRSGADYCDVTGAISFRCTHSQQKTHGQDFIKANDKAQIENGFAKIAFSRSCLSVLPPKGQRVLALMLNHCLDMLLRCNFAGLHRHLPV